MSRYDLVKMSYKQFIKDAILCFHDSPDDMKKIEDIIHEIKQGRKPNFNVKSKKLGNNIRVDVK